MSRLMRYASAAALLVAVALTPAAAQRPADPAQAAPRLPTITLPAEFDRVLRDYERGWRARDAAQLATLFTDDGFVLSNGKLPVRGRANIAAAYAGAGGPLNLAALAYSASDTVGYIIGTYGNADPATHQGKFVLVIRRAPRGRWLIAADMDNPSAR